MTKASKPGEIVEQTGEEGSEGPSSPAKPLIEIHRS